MGKLIKTNKQMFWEEAANRGVNMDSFLAAQLESGVTNKYLRVLFKNIEYYMPRFSAYFIMACTFQPVVFICK